MSPTQIDGLPKVVPLLTEDQFTTWEYRSADGRRRCLLSWLGHYAGDRITGYISVRPRVIAACRLAMCRAQDRIGLPSSWVQTLSIPTTVDMVFGFQRRDEFPVIWRDTWESLGYFEADGNLWHPSCRATGVSKPKCVNERVST